MDFLKFQFTLGLHRCIFWIFKRVLREIRPSDVDLLPSILIYSGRRPHRQLLAAQYLIPTNPYIRVTQMPLHKRNVFITTAPS